MKQNDFISIVADAIQHQEGWNIGDRAYLNNNPGDLRFAGQIGADQGAGNFCVFQNAYAGRYALENDIRLKLVNGNYLSKTITDLITLYAPPSDNNPTAAYIQHVLAKFTERNWACDALTPISAIIAQDHPTVLIAVNQLLEPGAWNAIQNTIALTVTFAKQFVFVTRYTNINMSSAIVTGQTNGLGTASFISQAASQSVLAPYNEGQEFNLLLVDGSIFVGHPNPVGGIEYAGGAISNTQLKTTFSSAIYQGLTFTDGDARVIFHEFIHMLFTLCGNPDTLHYYLIAHGGYANNLLVDLQVVYNAEYVIYSQGEQLVKDGQAIVSLPNTQAQQKVDLNWLRQVLVWLFKLKQ